jgi:hypothetical protein
MLPTQAIATLSLAPRPTGAEGRRSRHTNGRGVRNSLPCATPDDRPVPMGHFSTRRDHDVHHLGAVVDAINQIRLIASGYWLTGC